MTNFARTNTFVSGTTITAAASNQNWTDVETFLNTTGVGVYQTLSVTTAALAANAVTGAKLAATIDTNHTFSGTNTFSGAQTFTVAPVFSAAPRHGVQAFTTTDTVLATGGKLVTVKGTFTLTLPSAVAGMEFEIYNGSASTTTTIAANSGDSVLGGNYALTALKKVTLIAIDASSWLVSGPTTMPAGIPD